MVTRTELMMNINRAVRVQIAIALNYIARSEALRASSGIVQTKPQRRQVCSSVTFRLIVQMLPHRGQGYRINRRISDIFINQRSYLNIYVRFARAHDQKCVLERIIIRK
jgi:hypothetical protein